MLKEKRKNLLIVGCGDIAYRMLPWLTQRYRVFCLIHNQTGIKKVRQHGAIPILADLDFPPRQLTQLAKIAAAVSAIVHLVPPSHENECDKRTVHLLHVLGWGLARRKQKSLAQRLIYISTSGVYGDCQGEWVVESRQPHPETERAKRRLNTEKLIRQFGRHFQLTSAILRVPGIYAADRLPLNRLHQQSPSLQADDDVYTNHIHADDLAYVTCMALFRSKPGRIYHVCDDSVIKAGDYFELVANTFSLPVPPRIPRNEAEQQLSPTQMSFLRESRRLCNRRLKRELRVRLRYPTVSEGITSKQCKNSH